MTRTLIFVMCGCLAGTIGASAADKSTPESVTLTGWFSDASCATARAKSGTFTSTNPDCARRCIEKGEAPAGP